MNWTLHFDPTSRAIALGAKLPAYRERRDNAKKLKDEIVPACKHLIRTTPDTEVIFHLSDAVPDCHFRLNKDSEPQGLEVTVAQAKEQVMLAKHMNANGMSPGFIGLSDDATKKSFERALRRERVMYTRQQALQSIRGGVERCLSRKDNPKYLGHDLLIEVPLHNVSHDAVQVILPHIKARAAQTPFREVHIIGDGESRCFGFRLK